MLKIKGWLSLLFLAAAGTVSAMQAGGDSMDYVVENVQQKSFIGVEARMSNEECMVAIPKLWEKFLKEGIFEKIPNKMQNTVFVLYTDYESDCTKSYTVIIGCEVSGLEGIPEGLTGKMVNGAKYAAFTTTGHFPESVGKKWGEIWTSGLQRAYTTDFEVYREGFDPEKNPEVKIYIAM